jgi:N-acetylneuraminic acid mutarotase
VLSEATSPSASSVHQNQLEENMSLAIRWMRWGIAAVWIFSMFAVTAHAQRGRWSKAAPFPAPEEELYGITANGKMYVIGGFGLAPNFGKPPGMVYEYDPATDKWTKKKSIPVPVHHQAMAEYQGKIYVFGGYILNQAPGEQFGGWEPVDNVWEFDPVADSWKALAPLPGKRGSAIAAEVGGKIYVIGGAIPEPGSKEVAIRPTRPARSVGTNQVYDPATNTWEERSAMPTPRNHAFAGVVNGKIYVIGGRHSSPFITVASDLDVVEEYDPATNTWGAAKAPMPTPRSGGGWATYNGKIYVAGGELQTRQITPAFRAFEVYDPASNSWTVLPSLPIPRHGVAGAFIGNKLHFVSGKITSAGALDTQLETGSHDVYEVID